MKFAIVFALFPWMGLVAAPSEPSAASDKVSLAWVRYVVAVYEGNQFMANQIRENAGADPATVEEYALEKV